MKPLLYIVDINSYERNGQTQGHFVKVFQNYCEMLKETFDARVVGGDVFANFFDSHIFVKLPYCASSRTSNFINRLRNLINVRYVLRRCNEDTIIFQSSALTMLYLGLILFGKRNNKIYVINYSIPDGAFGGKLMRFLYKLAARKIDGNICSSDSLGAYLGRPYCVMPDYVFCSDMDVAQSGSNEYRYDFIATGLMNRSKGILDVVNRFASTKASLHIAGRFLDKELENTIRKTICSAPNVTLDSRYLPDKELNELIQSSRYMILNYQKAYSEHSSGMVFDALFNCCPVIGRKCKALQFIEDNCLGKLYEDISDFDPDYVVSNCNRNAFANNIGIYLNGHKAYVKKLAEFLQNTARTR